MKSGSGLAGVDMKLFQKLCYWVWGLCLAVPKHTQGLDFLLSVSEFKEFCNFTLSVVPFLHDST